MALAGRFCPAGDFSRRRRGSLYVPRAAYHRRPYLYSAAEAATVRCNVEKNETDQHLIDGNGYRRVWADRKEWPLGYDDRCDLESGEQNYHYDQRAA